MRPPAARRPRLAVTPLEDRLTPAVGNLLLSIPNPEAFNNERFGFSTAANGDRVVVGAPLDDPQGIADAGSAYVFDLATGNLVAALKNPEPFNGDRFGYSVAIFGTVAVVGAPFDDPVGVTDAGSAYIFDITTGHLLATLRRANADLFNDERFGNSVAVFGDRVVVGAPRDDPQGVFGAGSAFVYDLSGHLVATLNNPEPFNGDTFGCSVAATGTRAVVGASFDDPSGVTDAGSAYVFDINTGALVSTLVLTHPNLLPGDSFGFAVAASGNVAVVGAPFADPSGVTDAGAAYLFDLNSGALLSTLALDHPVAFNGQNLGFSVAASETRAVVGAPNFDPVGVTDAGAAFAFDLASGALVSTNQLPDPKLFNGHHLGYSVGAVGTLVVAGAPDHDPGGVAAAGSVFAFTGSRPAAPVLVGGALNGTAVAYTSTNGRLEFNRTVVFPNLSGVLHTAVADVNGDGTPDYIAATSEGAIARVNILSGTDLTLLSDFFPYGAGYNGGINLAAADYNGDGKADLAVAPDLPTLIGAVAPEVVVFDGASLIVGGFAELARFLGLDDPNGTGTDPNFRGGLRLGAGDVNGDGRPDLLVGAGTGGGPRITVWSGATFTGGGRPSANPLINLFVFESSQRGGAYIAAGDLNQDGFDDLYFGGGPGGSTRIRTVDGRLLFGLPTNQLVALDLDNSASFPAGLLRDNFFAAGGANFRGGVRLAARDVDADGFVDIVTGSGDGAPGSVRVYTAPQLDAARGVADPAGQDPLFPVGSDVLAVGVYVG